MFPGIKGYGVYVPRYRIKREDIAKSWQGKSRGENSVANSDEDIITMSTEAAQNAVRHAGIDPASIGAIYLGSTSAPNIEQSLLGTIAETLGTKAGTDMMCVGESTRAGTGAVKVCLDAIKAGTINNGLVIAADCRAASPGSDQELNFGVGAAAYILSSDNTVANIEEVFTYSTGFRDLWREAGSSYVKEYEPKLTRGIGRHDHMVNATKGLLASIGIDIDQFQHVVLYQPDARIPRVIAQTLGIKPEQTEKASIFPQLGDTGSSSVLLGLASVLDQAKPGDRILLVSYGSGISDAISLVVTNEVENKRTRGMSSTHYLDSKEYIDYLTYLKLNKVLEKGGEPAKMALPPLSPVVIKEGPELHRLIGAKCSKCGYVNFPPYFVRWGKA